MLTFIAEAKKFCHFPQPRSPETAFFPAFFFRFSPKRRPTRDRLQVASSLQTEWHFQNGVLTR